MDQSPHSNRTSVDDDYLSRHQAGPSSRLRPQTHTDQTLDEWLASPDIQSAPIQTRSRSLPRHDARNHDTNSPSSHHWSQLRTGVTAASALRSAKTDRQARRRNRRDAAAAASQQNDGWVDSEGLGDFFPGGGRSGRWSLKRSDGNAVGANSGSPKHKDKDDHLSSWGPLAHFLQQGSNQERSPLPNDTQSDQAYSSDIRIPGSSSSTTPTEHLHNNVNISEPESIIDHDPASIPRGENPLAFADNPKDLLDSDSDSDTDSDRDEDHAKAEGRKVAASRNHLLHGDTAPSSASYRSWLAQRLRPLLAYIFAPSLLSKGVTKCVVAYFLASLFTYSPHLSTFMARRLPNHDPDNLVPFSNLHMIATVAVYFHPARTFGSMVEADIFALGAFIFSMSLTVISMLVAEKLHDLHHPFLSNFLSVFFFLAGGMALVGYAKVKMGKPTFNTACSLIYVATFTVVVKEGAVHLGQFETDKVGQVSLVIFAGTLVANLVCFTVWPQSATTNLINDISRVLDAYSTLLKILTRTFLLEDPVNIHIRSSRVRGAIAAHHSAYTSMQKNLGEARFEAPFDHRIRGRLDLLQELVGSLNRLGGHLQGLRSSCATQADILQKDRDTHPQGAPQGVELSIKPFLDTIGPHMRSLVFTCSRTLQSLESSTRKEVLLEAFDEMEADLAQAIRRFKHEQVATLRTVATLEPKRGERQDRACSSSISLRNKMPTEDDESLVVVFFFVFNLEELAQELVSLVKITRALKERSQMTWRQWIRRLLQLERLESAVKLPLAAAYMSLPASLTFPANARHTPSTAHTPATQDSSHRLSYKLWSIGEFFKQRDVRFAIKTGFGCAILAAPAFLAETRPTFVRYKGQWALVSFMVVLSPTVGQSNQMSVHRILGTIFGAIVAASAYWTFEDNNIVLPLIGATFSIPCFRYIVGKPHLASSGRFVLLTFNLTCLYAYNLRKTNVEVESVAFERTVAVVVGVVWATILNHLLWPNEARRELANGISELLFKLSWLYQCLVIAYSSEDPHLHPRRRQEALSTLSARGVDELESQPLLRSSGPPPTAVADGTACFPTSLFQTLEVHIQFHLVRLEGLLAQTKHEPRLKGPFPIQQYREYLVACTDILDKLHSMRCIIGREEWIRVRTGWIAHVNRERREVVGNILLFFHVLATSSTLKTPLPPYLPPAEGSRQALAAKIRSLPYQHRPHQKGHENSNNSTTGMTTDTILINSYLLAMQHLVADLEKLGDLSWQMFGVWGGTGGGGLRGSIDRDGGHGDEITRGLSQGSGRGEGSTGARKVGKADGEAADGRERFERIFR